ncbi:MAG: transposase [Caulobacteraceae bacterium]
MRVRRDAVGIEALITWLQSLAIERVGLEASGGYERMVIDALEAVGLEVVLHQPLEVRLFARLKRLRAKNDRLDAALIAAATAQVDAVKAAADPRLRDLADRLTAYEQISDQLAELRGFLEHVASKDVLRQLKGPGRLVGAVEGPAGGRRAGTSQGLSRPCGSLRVADLSARHRPDRRASLVVRMPELGQMKRGQAAALLGVAPFDHDSGLLKGKRFIAGGRRRPRRLVYLAALSAKRWDPDQKAFAQRLAERGKPAKLIIVAVMRRLIEAANLILARQTPWVRATAP